MGGRTVFRLQRSDPNVSVILETMTQYGKHLVMAQRFLPEIKNGDKRIILVDGNLHRMHWLAFLHRENYVVILLQEVLAMLLPYPKGIIGYANKLRLPFAQKDYFW
jgi:hypothetical protein